MLECLVVEEELGDVAEVLAVDPRVGPVHLKHRDVALPVYLIARRVPQAAPFAVPQQLLFLPEEGQAELADVEDLFVLVLHRKRREVPAVHHVPPHTHLVDRLELGVFIVFGEVGLVEPLVVRVVLCGRDALHHLARQHLGLVLTDALLANPAVQTPVPADPMDIVVVAVLSGRGGVENALGLAAVPGKDDLCPLPQGSGLRVHVPRPHLHPLRNRLRKPLSPAEVPRHLE
mmetsp:Transcript_52706/g.132499  ORF Transcript_52706/g.132499 Transcript_52706/m.132499 type:complete len:231 (+) Transcript_52706:904-1596(+)